MITDLNNVANNDSSIMSVVISDSSSARQTSAHLGDNVLTLLTRICAAKHDLNSVKDQLPVSSFFDFFKDDMQRFFYQLDQK